MKRFPIIRLAHNPRLDANLFFLFVFGSPMVALAADIYWSGMGNLGVIYGLSVLIVAHGLAGLLFGLTAVDALDEKRPPWSAGRRAFVITMVATGLFSVFELFLPATILSRSSSLPFPSPSCQDNLKRWGLVHSMYAVESEASVFPPLSPNPGQLTLAFGEVYPELLTDLSIVQCPSIYQPRLRSPYDSELFATAADQSYFYLGYFIDGPETLRAFRSAYEKVIVEGDDFESDLVVPEGQGTWGGSRILRLTVDAEIFGHNADFDVDNPAGDALVQSSIPIIIERPVNHGAGGNTKGSNILFMDGHIEFRKYPGEWPMTEEAMGILREIDEMGSHIREVTSGPPKNRSSAETLFIVLVFGLAIAIFVFWRFVRSPIIALPVYSILVGLGFYLFVHVAATVTVVAPDGNVTYHRVEYLNRPSQPRSSGRFFGY